MEYTRLVGWDVHAATIAVAHAVPGRGPATFEGTLRTDPGVVHRWVERQPDRATLLVCYEAGPSGYGWARQLAAGGLACEVVGPGARARQSHRPRQDGPAAEVVRDLVRARTRAVQDQTRVRHRVKSALLRWGVHPAADRAAWSAPYLAWLRAYVPADAARAAAWTELLGTLEEADARVRRLTAALEARWPQHPLAPLIRALQALRGINWLTAVIVLAELGDGAQFAHPRALMAFWGLVPTETSSGARLALGGCDRDKPGLCRLRCAARRPRAQTGSGCPMVRRVGVRALGNFTQVPKHASQDRKTSLTVASGTPNSSHRAAMTCRAASAPCSAASATERWSTASSSRAARCQGRSVVGSHRVYTPFEVCGWLRPNGGGTKRHTCGVCVRARGRSASRLGTGHC